MKNNPTTMIKCKFSNAVHKLLEPNINIKKDDRWRHNKNYQISNEEKIKLFDQIREIHNECSAELTQYQFDKREKKRIHKARVERGYKFKKKTSKKDYEKSLEKDLELSN